MAIFLLLFMLAIIVAIKFSLRPANFPPGPRGVPLLGYAPFLPKNVVVHKAMQNLAKTYGSVIGIFIGPHQAIVSVSGMHACKEALLNEDLNGRPSGAIVLSRTFGEKLGLAIVEGEFWKEQRRFTLRHLRDLGFGKTLVENQMMDEITDLLSYMKSAAQSDPDHIIDFNGIFSVPIINMLWAILAGKRYQRDDVALKKILFLLEKLFRNGNFIGVFFPIPAFLVRLFPFLPKMFGIDTGLLSPLQRLIKETIEEHLSTRSEGDEPRDFFDVYLDEIVERLRKDQSPTFSEKQLFAVSLDLFGGGSDTSKNTIGFAILYLIHYPEIQEKIQKELNDVCGNFLPSLAHRPSLPYTEAFIAEVMRIRTVLPLGVPHCAIKETQLQGFTIPKGTIVLVNLESALNDPSSWDDPELFNPKRHLNEDGKFIKKETLTGFGLGKRMCLGEPLARNTVFLFIASLAKTFEFKPIPNQPPPTLEPDVGFALSPKPFKAVAIPRSH